MDDEFEFRECAWEKISKLVAPSEVQELKILLGEAVVDDTIELREEVHQLREIWRSVVDVDVRKNTEGLTCALRNGLPEPPHVRDNLNKEIILFLELLSAHNGQDKREVLKYLQGGLEFADFADTAGKSSSLNRNKGKVTPFPCNEEPFSMDLLLSAGVEEQSSDSNLAAFEKLHGLALQLRMHLVQEREALLADVEFLQESIVNSATQQEMQAKQPSLQELRKLGTKLEQEVLKTCGSSHSRKVVPGDSCLNNQCREVQQTKRSCASAPLRHLPSPPSLSPLPPAAQSSAIRSRRFLNNGRAFSLPLMTVRKDTENWDESNQGLLEGNSNGSVRQIVARQITQADPLPQITRHGKL